MCVVQGNSLLHYTKKKNDMEKHQLCSKHHFESSGDFSLSYHMNS